MKKQQTKTEAPLLTDAAEKPFFSERKNVVRLVLFVLALAVAVGSIGFGVYRIGYREPGDYTIEADPDGDLPYYASGVTFVCHMTGSSADIRARLSDIKTAYTAALKQSYKLFDAETVYPDTVNLAAVNEHPGEEIEVPAELFAALSDAWDKTCEKQGYSAFAGPLNDYRDRLVYSFDGALHDPLADADAAALLADLTARLSEDGAVTLTLNEAKRTVRLDVSPSLTAFLDAAGIESPLLDLGLLREAYRLQTVVNALERGGYTEGRLSTESGLSVSLSGDDPVRYCLYSREAGGVVLSCEKQGRPGTVASLLRTFAFHKNETGFYTVETSDGTVFRHRFMTSFAPQQVVDAVLTVGTTLADQRYWGICLFACPDKETALTMARASKGDVVFSFADEAKVLYATSQEGLTVLTEAGYTVNHV